MCNETHQISNMVERYISICNVALFRNSARFPFKQILEAAEKLSCGRKIEMTIDGLPDSDAYVLSISDGRINAEKHNCGEVCNCDGKWLVSREYLQNVVEHAPIYIENPALIDWEWLYIK